RLRHHSRTRAREADGDDPPPRAPGVIGLKDRHLIYLAALQRATGLSMLAILAGAYLLAVAPGSMQIGAIGAVGFAGAMVAALLATLRGDRWGRRRVLIATALSAAGGTLLFAIATE